MAKMTLTPAPETLPQLLAFLGKLSARQRLHAAILALPEPPTHSRKKQKEWGRASGQCVCSVCGWPFADHPKDPDEPCLTILCNRDRVKL